MILILFSAMKISSIVSRIEQSHLILVYVMMDKANCDGYSVFLAISGSVECSISSRIELTHVNQ